MRGLSQGAMIILTRYTILGNAHVKRVGYFSNYYIVRTNYYLVRTNYYIVRTNYYIARAI